jgi:signal recognition particle receptor subunit beta
MDQVLRVIDSFNFPIQSQIVLYIAVATIVSLLLLTILFLRRSSKTSNTVLLLGLCNAGKTALFLRLKEGKITETYTSMKENDATFAHANSKNNKSTTLHVVDFPGHQRLRPALDTFLPAAGAIVFLIDALEFRNDVSAVAQYLYDLFVHPVVNSKRLPILIACNKSEMVTALPKDAIADDLQAEINQVRKNQGTMADIDGKKTQVSLGIKGKNFKWEHLPFPVSFAECSVKEGDIAQIEEFIHKYIH